jgi:hypothetical protein
MRTFNPTVECLEDRLTPIVHSFSAGAVASSSPNAGGSEAARAAILDQSALGATPVPVVAAGENAQGVPFDFVKPHAPGRDVVLSHQ